MTHQRNALGPAYTAAEALYDNSTSLVQFLDAWSQPGRADALSVDALAYLAHNLVNARANLDRIEELLRPPVVAVIATTIYTAAQAIIDRDAPSPHAYGCHL